MELKMSEVESQAVEADEAEDAALENTTPYVGALTAIRNGNVAMTVTKLVDNEGCPLIVECTYFVGNALKTFYAETEAFIGFGENLAFSGGAFIYAFDDEE
jgi:hypothetical protein